MTMKLDSKNPPPAKEATGQVFLNELINPPANPSLPEHYKVQKSPAFPLLHPTLSKSKRLGITVSPKVMEQLVQITRDEGCKMSDLVKHALSLEIFYNKVKKESPNNRFCIEREGKIHEVVMPYL